MKAVSLPDGRRRGNSIFWNRPYYPWSIGRQGHSRFHQTAVGLATSIGRAGRGLQRVNGVAGRFE